MKLNKSVLALAVLSLFLNVSNAQVVHKVKVLLFQHVMAEFPLVFADSVIVTYTSNDTTWFNTSVQHPFGKSYFYRAGSKVYRENFAMGPVLYYDYSLVKGDTFFSHIGHHPDTFIVDSIYYKKLNHRTFKAWHLTSVHKTNKIRWDWIEGLGELGSGWDTRGYFLIDAGWEIKGMCLNDSVIYWNTAYNYFKDREPIPTCLFDSVSKRLGLQEKIAVTDFTFYPNPASDGITIHATSDGLLSIMDQTGRIFIDNKPFIQGTQILDISTLQTGIYFMAIRQENKVLLKKICVVNH